MERAAAQFIVNKLGQLLIDEVQDIRGVGYKVVLLMDELSTMNAALRMISEADQSAVDHLTREWEKQVCELAYDAEDCADTYWLRVKRPILLQLPSIILKWPKYQLEKLLLRRALAADVKALLARTTAVSERRVRYGIDRVALPRSPWFAPVSGVSASTNALCLANDPADQFVGLKEQVTALAKIKEEDSDKRLKVFSIVGFGGLGKTTLAVELCRHLEAVFQCQALVSVSQAFDGRKDMKGLLARVLKQIVKVKKDEEAMGPSTTQEDGGQTEEAVGTSTTQEDGGQTEEAVSPSTTQEDGGQIEEVVGPSTTQEDGGQTEEVVGTSIAQSNQINIDQIDQMNEDQLSTSIEEQLMGKRYLIVIDDVWSQPAWEAIRNKLPENNCSSRIIVTTRIETVAKAASVSEDLVHHMIPLELKASQELFIKRVFGSMGGTCPDVLEDAMSKILKKCGGMPLAIVSIASLLPRSNSVESVEMWNRVSKSIGSQMESHPTLEGMRQVITLSYDYLPHHLKACMMYLSIFPEDHVIAKDRLLCRWIAEGLVSEKRGLTLFDVAEEYFNELISRNMIQLDKLIVARNFFPVEMVEACRVHDMMLEVMVSKSQDANFVSFVGWHYVGGLSGGKVRRLSVHDNDDKEHISSHKKEVEQRHHARHGIETMNLQQVRSLTVFQSEGLERLLDRLGEFKLLRVLDLEDCKALKDKHMRDVCRLYLLRFLSLRGTEISEMPSEIGDLEYLETLDVQRTHINDMPPTVTKLSRLEGLCTRWWNLPQGLGNMKALCKVNLAVLKGNVQVAREIGELQQLQVLDIVIMAESEELFSHALGSSLSKTCALRSLQLYSERTLEFLLHVSSPPPLLRCLFMNGPISRFPDWISNLKHLVEFSVIRAEHVGDQELLDSLCDLPNLQSIKLRTQSCGHRELVARTTHKFPVLQTFNLSLTRIHPKEVKFEEGSMTKLEKLLLDFRNEWRSIVGIENLKNLKEVKLKGMKSSQSLERAVVQLKAENENRPNQFKVIVEYW